MLSICSMGKKTDHPSMYQQQPQRASLSSAWGVDLLPPTIQETGTSYSLESVSETLPPATIKKSTPSKGREGLLNSQFLNAAQGEKEGDHTVVEVSSVQEQGVFMDRSTTSTLGEISSSNIFLNGEQRSEQQTLTSSGSQVEPAVDESKNTLVIKNLPFKFKQADLDKILSDNQAKPKNVRLLRDDSGRFTGIAFVRCPSKDEATRLILNMNAMDVGGRAIQVEFKKKKSKKKQQQQQQKLTLSGSSLLSSSGDSDRWSVDSDETPSRRLAFSDEILQQLSPPSNIPPTYSMLLEKPVKKLSISDEHTITDKYLRRSANDVPPQQMASSYMQQQNPYQSSSLFSNQPQVPPGMSSANAQQPFYGGTPYPYPVSRYTDNVDYQQARRKSFSVVEGRAQQHANYYVPPGNRRSLEDAQGPGSSAWNFYPRSAIPRALTTSDPANNLKYASVRPLRQPFGPDGKSKGFSLEYQLSRKSLLTSPSPSASLPTFAPSLHPY